MTVATGSRYVSFAISLALIAGIASTRCSTSDAQTGVLVVATFSSNFDQLGIAVAVDAEQRAQRVPEAGAEALSSPRSILVLLPSSWGGKQASIDVEGYSQGQLQRRETASVALAKGRVVEVAITLGRCDNGCPVAEQKRCQGDGFVVCEADSAGCLSWSAVTACAAATPYCSDGVCADTCSDECSADARVCVAGNNYKSCGQHDSDSCRDWSAPISCGKNERCRESDGRCIPDCGGKPCPCKQGETSACAAVGECQNGVRHCEEGAFGPCQWATPPAAEICDGKDNDCDGDIDETEDLIAPTCDEQDGVCSGARQRCGGKQGWLACSASDLTAHAQRNGQTYEAQESLCDSEDNDCNGQVDDAPGCCQPQCVGKACGADDTCGGKCQTGSCQADATCKAGACVCDHVVCGSACCKAGETCQSGSCKPPTSCTAVPATAIESQDDVGAYPGIAVDNGGNVHISYYFSTSSELRYVTNKSGAWKPETLQSAGNVGSFTSIALDAKGSPHIIYRSPQGNAVLHASNKSGSWVFTTVHSSFASTPTAVTIDKSGYLHAVFADVGSAAIVHYASDQSGAWKVQDIGPNAAVYGAVDIAVDGSDAPVVLHHHPSSGLQLQRRNGGTWQSELIRPGGVTARDVALAFDTKGKAHVAYTSAYEVLYTNNVNGSWATPTAIAVGKVSYMDYVDLAVDSKGFVHIVYRDVESKTLRYANDKSGTFKSQVLATTDDPGYYVAITVDAQDAIHVVHHPQTSGDLVYLKLCP
ncbi:MAG: hypothetical protein H6707_21635 [Deltaproteobacteria bacterium]|nr:hypothetical protein [Deltaproteobacteria bacterium]